MKRLVLAAFAAAAGAVFGVLVLAEGLKEAWPPNLNGAFHTSLGVVLLVQAACFAAMVWSARTTGAAIAYAVAGATLSLATAFGSEIFGPLVLAVFVVATAVLAFRVAGGTSQLSQVR